MGDKTLRPLALALLAQLLIGAVLLLWATQGFPLPATIGGADDRTTPRASGSAAPAAAPRAPDRTPPADEPGAAALAPRPTTDRFDARRAFALLREQVLRFGWRPAGSAALRRLAVRLRAMLPHGRFEPVPGHRGLRNVVGSIAGRGTPIVVGAHYDVEARPKGFVGANDGAAGSAAVVWLARALARSPRERGDRPLRFVLFDGEEEPAGCVPFVACGLRGSTAYAARHGREVHSLVLLDYIAEKQGLRFPREGTSNRGLWEKLRSAAARVGVGALFTDAAGVGLLDDHTPFIRRAIPAIDVIDYDYPSRDTLADDLDEVSQRSLDAVGEAVYRLVSRLRREP
jgi:glutaminyl-peptide cyclotransferase